MRRHFGRIDIYIFDQLLRGQITPDMRILDAGCGDGRNAEYLMRCGADISCVDADAGRVDSVRTLAADIASHLPAANFRECRLDALPYSDHHFDAVICSAVLHFACDEDEFDRMVKEMWRVLAPGGVLFARLASSIGLEGRVRKIHGRRHELPDGSERFLVDEACLVKKTAELGGDLLDRLKTTVVQDMRSMTTWVVRKP